MSEYEGADKDLMAGHRNRLRDKLLNHGKNSLADYELLELLLGIAIPRLDVKPTAKLLLQKFGNFAGVIHAPPDKLKEIKGIGDTAAAAIKIVEAAGILALSQIATEKPVITNWNLLQDYLRLSLGGATTEEFHILYLDSKLHLIKDETQSVGSINTTQVYPREILKQVLALGAASVILVHNHPTGDLTPSKQDIDLTIRIAETLKTIDVSLHDHIIVSTTGTASFKQMGLIF